MGRPVTLEEFARAQETTVAQREMDEQLDQARFEAFDDGYKSGWSDSQQALEETRSQISADFAQNLRDMSFTYHEARGHVLGALRPVMSEMTGKVLPSLVKSGFAETVSEIAMAFAAEEADAPFECAVAAANRPFLADLVAAHTSPPISVVEDPSLGEVEVRLRSGEREMHFDGDRLLSDMQAAVDTFFTSDKELQTG